MPAYAFSDKERLIKVYAKDCGILDVGKRFYCENKECDAHLAFRAYKSIRVAHFAAIGSHPHTGWCRHDVTGFSATNYEESMFNYDSTIDGMISETIPKCAVFSRAKLIRRGKGKRRSISTLSQLYNMCKSLDHKDSYNGHIIWKILFDCRCNYILTRGLSGKHIIECIFKSYNNEMQTLTFAYPAGENLPNKYKLKVRIDNRELYFLLKNKVYNYENRIIVVAGEWHKCSQDQYECKVVKGNQLYFPKRKPTDDPYKTDG